MQPVITFTVKNSTSGAEVYLSVNDTSKEFISSHGSYPAALESAQEFNDILLDFTAKNLQVYAQQLHDQSNTIGLSYYEHAQLRAIKAVHLYKYNAVLKIRDTQLATPV